MFEDISLFVVHVLLVPDIEYVLGLTQNKRKLIKLREQIWPGGTSGYIGLFLDYVHNRQCCLCLAGLRLLSRHKHSLSINSKYLLGDNLFRA